MAKRKPKPATAGEKMLLITMAGHKRTIARAVRKERERCEKIVIAERNNFNTSYSSVACLNHILLIMKRPKR